MIRKWIKRWEEEGSAGTSPRSGRQHVASHRMGADDCTGASYKVSSVADTKSVAALPSPDHLTAPSSRRDPLLRPGAQGQAHSST